MSNENELLEPLATEAGQQAIARAINNLSSLEYAVRAERAATTATQKADEALNSAEDASDYATEARNWATKTDGYVDQETITIPPEQEGDEPTTETIDLYSARYYAALAQDIYNNLQFDTEPIENSTKLLSSGAIYTALNGKADKSTTYTKTETDTLINTKLAELVSSAPATLDTLQELATALGNDPNFATTIATQLGNKADKSDTYTKTEVDTALSNVQGQLTFDNVPTANSDNPVKSSGIKTALDGKQDNLTFDSTPTANSNNPVTSGGIYTALQNVNIDIDDEITEDSDNPVTSAAIYEALQNFTPSGGGGSSGNASGIIIDKLYSGNSTALSVGRELNLSHTWKDYDFIEFGVFPNSAYLSNNNPYDASHIYSTKAIQDCYTANSNFRLGIFLNTDNSTLRLVSLRVFDTKFVVNTVASSPCIEYIYGIKFSKNLSEQMYSNVLYENSSGWNSGSITLNDALDNYDFISVSMRVSSDPPEYMNEGFFSTKSLLDGRYFCLTGYASRNFNASIDSTHKILTRISNNDYLIYKIVGYKMAKGGYSGIVSDARMTVKSGTVEHISTLSGNATVNLPVVFDSPMPDTNYIVQVTPNFGGTGWANAEVTTENKTINGFNIIIFGMHGSTTVKPKYDWIAIRPNSYTREGMVEDVLFSNASGATGIINLSHNMSDYDLLLFYVSPLSNSNGYYRNSIIFTPSYLQNLTDATPVGNTFVLNEYGSRYIKCQYVNDTTINAFEASGSKIEKIIGIKFGRYVSGVKVDDTITSSGTGVPSTSAVYTALQNAGGGGGGSSVTVDSSITENSTNPVESAALYDVLYPILPSTLSDITIPDIKLNNTNGLICSIGGRNYYKTNSDLAACIITQFKVNSATWTSPVLVSLTENGAKSYSSYSDGGTPTVNTFTYDGTILYYSSSPYTWYDKTLSDVSNNNVRIVNRVFDSLLEAAQYLASLVVQKDNTLSTFYIKDAYTKTEIDTLIQNAGGGSSITVDSTITQGGTNPVEGGAIYTALEDKADKSTTYTKTEVDTAISSKGDVTTNTDQNITGTKTFVGSKKVGFKQSAANDKLGFTLFGNTGTERGYLEFNPTNTVDGVAGLMTLGNYATSAAGLTQVGFRRYSNISGQSGAYNLLMPMVADAKTPFSLTTSYQNFYLPLGFTDGTTTVKTAKSGLVDLSPLLASLEARIAALEGN